MTTMLTTKPKCRVCGAPMQGCLADLGMIPLCQSFIDEAELDQGEMFYPLRVHVCMHCYYVGLQVYVSPHEMFSEYAYFSSVSASWIDYARASVESLVGEFALDAACQVVEMGSNDGYLLQFFVEKGIPALGVEPAANVAKVANERGVPTLAAFFNRRTARDLRMKGKLADLLLAYNCLDHVPNLNEVVAAMKLLLKPRGVIQIEMPYLDSLVEGNQFDTIYHDRYSYLSFLAAEHLFDRNGLRIFDATRIPTHGGSLRLRATHAENSSRALLPSVARLRADETDRGMKAPGYYSGFMDRIVATKRNLLEFLICQKREGLSDRWLWGAGQGQCPVELLWHWARFHRLSRGSQSIQAGEICSRHSPSGSRCGGGATHAARSAFDPPMEHQGGNRLADVTHTAMGRTVPGGNSRGRCPVTADDRQDPGELTWFRGNALFRGITARAANPR